MERHALVLVDIQNDFFPGGGLAVPNADRIVPVINTLRQKRWHCVCLAVDWHPTNHCSFSSNNP